MSETHKLKTGTTCIGMLCKDGVVLASDRRITGGIIWTDEFSKVVKISDKIVSTMAGHAADNVLVLKHIQGELKLIELKAERSVRVKEAAMLLNGIQYSMLRQSGAIVSLILGGYDEKDKFSLYDLQPDGTINPNKGFVVDGSGATFIRTLFQSDYRPDMSEKEVLSLIEKAFMLVFKNDNASGGGYVASIVTKDGVKEVSRKLLKTEFVNE